METHPPVNGSGTLATKPSRQTVRVLDVDGAATRDGTVMCEV